METSAPSATASTDHTKTTSPSSHAVSGRNTRRSVSSVATAREKLQKAMAGAEETLNEVRDWIRAHDANATATPDKSAAVLGNQLRAKLDKVSTTQADHDDARKKAASTTLASAISVINPNIDLEEIEMMIKSGTSAQELARALGAKLSEAADV